MPVCSPPLPAWLEPAIDGLGEGPLTESGVRRHVFPLFSRVLEREEIYLANHSLGRPPDRMAEDVRGALDLWYRDLDGAWGAWLAEQSAYRANMARLIGCSRPDAVVPKTSAAQGLRAVLNALPGPRPVVVATRGEFDSIDFVLKAYAAKGLIEVRWVAGDERGLFHGRDVEAAVADGVDLVVVSQVVFATGQVVMGIEGVVGAAHAAGAAVLLDAYHSAGVTGVGFDRLGADFAIGGNYKYTRGGPGACWLAIHPRHLTGPRTPASGDLAPVDTGWFAKVDPMAFERSDAAVLAGGGDAWLEATPAVLTYYQCKAGVELLLALGVERVREYNLGQQAFMTERLRERRVEPVLIEPRGAFLLVESEDAPRAARALKQRGVNTDARRCPTTGRGFVRVCPDILTTEEEMARAAAIIAGVVRGA